MINKEYYNSIAPAVLATRPKNNVSDKYVFVPTYEIIDFLEKEGYKPFSVSQTGRKTNLNPYQKHMIRFRHMKYFDGNMGEIPELVMINSHNRTSALKFFFGVFRSLCSNGLITMSLNIASLNTRHINFDINVFEGMLEAFVGNSENILEKIDDFKSIHLTSQKKQDFASEAKNIIWPKGNIMDSTALLKPRRKEDEADDLFTVYNVVQENAMKGGIEYQGAKKKVKTKQVKNIDRNLLINVGLWNLMEKYYN